jgi:hypothetical protein
MRTPALALLLTASLWISDAQAVTYVYTYTGPNFDTSSAPYTTDMSVSGTFSLDSPLAPDLEGADIYADLSSWAFNNGVNSYSSDTPINNQTVTFSTDSSGEITDWGVVFASPNSGEGIISTCGPLKVSINVNGHACNNPFLIGDDAAGNVFGAQATVSGQTGTWTLVILPEPSTGLLFSAGLFVFTLRGVGLKPPATERTPRDRLAGDRTARSLQPGEHRS